VPGQEWNPGSHYRKFDTLPICVNTPWQASKIKKTIKKKHCQAESNVSYTIRDISERNIGTLFTEYTV